MEKDSGNSFIVVGVDGSDSSKDALRWAAGQARRCGGDLHAVGAWVFPAAHGWTPDFSDVDFAAEARKGLDATIAQVLGDGHHVSLVVRVEQGHAAQVLVDASCGADLLVVGS